MAESTRKKTVSVSFAGDDDVVQHIYSLNAKRGQVRSKKKKQLESYQTPGSDSETEESEQSDAEQNSSQNEDADEAFRPSEALAEEGITGESVYGFKTMKRSSQMAAAAKRAVESLTPSSPAKSSTQLSEPTTPKSILKKTRGQLLSETGQTPVSQRASRRNRRIAMTMPHRIRTRQKGGGSSSDSADSDSSDSDEDSDDESAPSTPSTAKKAAPKPATPRSVPNMKRRGKKQLDETVEADTVEAYFEAHATSKVVTSDRTLSRLDTPRMDHAALAEVLTHVTEGMREEKEELRDAYRGQYNSWMYMLCHGYNLLFHGLGSKRSLLEEFRAEMLKDYSHVIVNGYFPSLTIKSILTTITEEVLEHTGTFRSPIEQCDFIRKHFECGDYEDFFLLIHNIDGAMLRGEKAQTILSLLAQIRGFHIVASLDHINAPLLWDGTACSRFSWLWYDVTTYEAYRDETSYENSLLVAQTGVLALSSLTHVLRSLTPNARGIFILLVKHQMEHSKDNQAYQGLSFEDLYQKCREDFLVNSDITLRTQLTEFKDHKLIKLKKGGMDGVEYLHIPLDNATLGEFLENHESEQT